MDRPTPARLTSRDLTPRQQDALLSQTVVLAGTLSDLVVALVRLARGSRGSQLGPTLVTLVLAAGAPPLARWAMRVRGRRGRAVLVALLVAVPTLPAAAGGTRGTVVGSGNPLWQLAVSAGTRVVGGGVLVLPSALAAGRRRRARVSRG
ncbi:hypothetical protein [Modestobacter roseus]|uniref:Uncharacterized protein n=1 Tax=Modestobacter roseus TaxID=1181884 RepID=A0A562ILA9_9ACTN|nr:hypothetical protein [Modestobacter roseus]MQA32301.1 hypothetical protein [Modestobacter roseus]TWH71797.1 hypothetical protein JD78_00295 [Modestobacter roseus]